MNKPGPLQWIADPPEVWATAIDVLIEKVQEQVGVTACPPWPGQNACPLAADGKEQCWGEKACWLYWAYMLAVMRMAKASAVKATDLQGTSAHLGVSDVTP
jgi:hypothetical protein